MGDLEGWGVVIWFRSSSRLAVVREVRSMTEDTLCLFHCDGKFLRAWPFDLVTTH